MAAIDGGGHLGGEDLAVHGERVAAWDTRLIRHVQQQRAQAAQFLFEEPRRGGFELRFERVAAHQFGQAAGLMRRRAARGTHLMKHRAQTAPGDLPCRLGARQSSADDVNGWLQLSL